METIKTTEYWEESSRLEETCCHSDSSGKPSVNAGVKNSQKSKLIIINSPSSLISFVEVRGKLNSFLFIFILDFMKEQSHKGQQLSANSFNQTSEIKYLSNKWNEIFIW